ncbi:MAG: response regulator [Desulfatirhabdiaceae bacterium]
MTIHPILIVDDEKSLILSIQAGFESFRDRYRLYTAENGKQAIEILKANPIDILVTDIRMPEMDGFELIVYMNTHYPTVPIIVMSAYGTREIESRLNNIGIVRFLDKPVAFEKLISSIEDGLTRGTQSGSMTGISVGSFLQLLEVEEKTCLLDVQTNGKKGLFYLNQGKLYDAVCGNLVAEEAAIEMIMWEGVKLQFKSLPDRKIIRRITTDIMAMLMEASRRKDEINEPEETENFPLDFPVSGIIDHIDTDQINLDSLPNILDPLQGDKHTFEKIRLPDTHESLLGNDPDIFEPIPRLSIKKVNDLLKTMALEISGVVFLGVFDRDGIRIADFPSASSLSDAFPAHMTTLMNAAQKAVTALKGREQIEEQIVQTSQSWILCRPLSSLYYLGIIVEKPAILGNIRLVAEKNSDALKRLFLP